MDITLSFGGIAALFTAMAVLATVPSTSVLIVTTRAATQGFMHGAWVSAGVVLGDLFFIVLAIAGLAMLIEWLGPFFVAIKIAGALYLVWLGQALWRRSHGMVSTGAEVAPASVFGSFFSGLALTLGDQKAVLFYLGFLPAFVNLGALTVPDTAIVMAAAAVAVGGVKLAYAAVAARSGRRINGHEALAMARLAGMLVTVIGLFSLGTVLIDALA
ncbi:MAG: LysE family translocator [Polycyclovorans sp.]|nr:LysE family translocator [Polycyclovorans sp.]